MATSNKLPDPVADSDPRRHSPAAERNRDVLLAELQRLLPQLDPAGGVLLEIASGSGQHAAHCSPALPGWHWLPSDANPDMLPSIRAWCDGLERVRAPILLDVLQPPWPGVPDRVDAMLCANMIHAAPWACCRGLMHVAARHLAPHGRLITYGPYLEDGVPTAASNLAFDADLRTRDAAWGLRRREDVEREAAAAGLTLEVRVPMPSNNLLLVWSRAASGS